MSLNLLKSGAGVDAHQHFWLYHPEKHSWIDDSMANIRKNFLPADLAPILSANGMEGCVAVQADQTEVETNFLLELASKNAFIKGVVGWVDLRSASIKDVLSQYAQNNKLKGFRHILQGEEPAFMLQPDFINGIAALNEFGFTYDILIFPKHLDAALELVKQFPNQPFVIDHIAKPYIKAGLIDEWKKGMQALAAFDNVHCKVSGMVTEADFKLWKSTDFTPYLDVVFEAFGTKRILFGTDWPVCEVAAKYDEVVGIVANYCASLSETEQYQVFRDNSYQFYKLSS